MKLKNCLLLAVTFLFAQKMLSQPVRIPAEHTLSNSYVNCMVEDDEGYIWIGTRRGLNRFNGSTYKVFYQVDSLSLPNDFISSLCSDTDGRLWVGTSTGLCMLKDGVPEPGVNVKLGPVFGLASYDEDRLLVLSRTSLYIMDKHTLSYELIHEDETLVMADLLVTDDGKVWIYDGLNPVANVLDKDFSLIKTVDTGGLHINGMSQNKDGYILMAMTGGLAYFDPDGKPIPLTDELTRRTKGKNVLFVTVNRSGLTCVGIKDVGYLLFSGAGHDIHKVWDEDDLASVSDADAILTEENIFVSREHGVMEYRYFSSDSNVLPVSFSDRESLNMFYPMSDERVFVLTNMKAYMMRTNSEKVVEIPIEGNREGDRLTISMFDSDSCLWILKNDTRLCRYSFDGTRLKYLAGYDVDKTNSIWGGQENEGIYILQNDGILQIRPDGALRRHRMMKYPDFWYCATTSSGLTYFLEDYGIWLFDEDRTIKKMPLEVNSPECMYLTQDGNLWVGSQGDGIFVYDRDLTLVRRLTVKDGLPDNTTRSILGDKYGNIWVSSRCEVYKIDPDTYDITLYGNPENMNLTYNTNSSHISDSGHVMLGSRTHIALFKSADVIPENDLQVKLDGLVVNGETIVDVPETVELEHDGNVISFYYSAMQYDPAMKLSYRYRLEGYDDSWINVGTAMRTNFAGLKRGKYKFVVSVRNSTGKWSENELEYSFRVKPSPWLSWPALLVYIIISIILLAVLVNLVLRLRANSQQLRQAEYEKLLNDSLAKEKTDFFTNISHEYRTPLSLIYGPAKELSGNNSLDEHDSYLLSLVVQNAERMMKLTDQVLNFYSYEKENLKIMKSDVSVFLRSMLNSFEYMARQKELTLVIHIHDGIRAYCDREKIERIFFNIISNAVKYTPEGGEITVKAGVADDMLSISVADTGVGISPENIKKIFNRFERAGIDESDADISGFGIGLNYAMHLAVLHKGMLTVSPNVPKGSVFTLAVPSSKTAYDPSVVILDTETSNENAIISKDISAEVNDVTVLVAEDNVELAGYIRHLLMEEYNVVLASNGNEAMECVKVSVPDIIISDVMMPYKDGYTLCADIKSDPEYCHLPVILLTAKTDVDSRVAGYEKGADAYLKKPFEPEVLLSVIKGMLENRKRMQAILSRISLSEGIPDEAEVTELKMNSHDRIFVEKLHAMMENHLSDEEFNVTAMSKEFAMSRTSLFSKMKALYGVSPQAWITDYRLNKAMELLQTREYNVSEVSYKVGFATLTGFSRSFKNKFGFPPSAV